MAWFGKKKQPSKSQDSTNNEQSADEQPSEKRLPGLTRMKSNFGDRILGLFKQQSSTDEKFIDELEEILIGSDVGVDTTMEILENMRIQIKSKAPKDYDAIKNILKDILQNMIPDEPYQLAEGKLNVLFIIGVNGTGKTTSIAKLAHAFKQQGKSIVLGACDTFRAAAIEQLSTWADRVDVPIVKQTEGSNPGATLYNSIDKAVSLQADLLIVDTAGRLHNRANLMAEIEKLNRILEKKSKEHPIQKQNLLVLDATTGQNAFTQAESFNKSIGVDGICLSKLDSTAKGGVVIALGYKLKTPVQFVGVGEKLEDLYPFNAASYLNALFE